jgi:AGZA family xanthine/uracil permease-like MFS transporter
MATAAAGVAPKDTTFLERRFKVRELGSTVGTELRAGVATYLTMCYILFVNAGIMSSVADHNGLKLGFVQVLTVTALVAGAMTLLMGLYANAPFALATGLGLNAFVAFTLVGGSAGLTWPQACGVIVMEGAVITVAMYTGLRELVIKAIPDQLKSAIGVGIGLFIAFIGLVSVGVVVKGNGTLVGLAPHYNTWPLAIFTGSLVVTGALVARGVKSALLLGIVLTTAVATLINWANDYTVFTNGSAKVPHSWIWPDFHLVGNFSFSFWSALPFLTAIAIVLSVLLSDFYDTGGTVTGISKEAGMVDEDGNPRNMKQILQIDSWAALAGGLSGNSSNTTFIESEGGVATGGRTGLTAVVVGVLFLASLGLAPIAGMVPAVATAPVLIIVGVKMFRLVREIDWDDTLIAAPALVTLLVMPATYSITNGVGAGFVLYVLLCLASGNPRRVPPVMYPVTAIFVWYFIHGVV